MADQWRTNEDQRAQAFRVLTELLDERGALRVQVEDATDILCALLALEVYTNWSGGAGARSAGSGGPQR